MRQMLPVDVSVLSTSSCTLSQASALLQRFLFSDACSGSFAADYVARALQVSTSRKAGGAVRRHIPSCSESPSRSSAQLVVVKHAYEAERDLRRHRKKRGRSSVESGPEMVPLFVSEVEDSAYMNQDRKRKEKEKHGKEREDYDFDDQEKKNRKEEREIGTENRATEHPASDSLYGSKKEKQSRYTEGMEFTENKDSLSSLLVDENLVRKSSFKAKKVEM